MVDSLDSNVGECVIAFFSCSFNTNLECKWTVCVYRRGYHIKIYLQRCRNIVIFMDCKDKNEGHLPFFLLQR